VKGVVTLRNTKKRYRMSGGTVLGGETQDNLFESLWGGKITRTEIGGHDGGDGGYGEKPEGEWTYAKTIIV